MLIKNNRGFNLVELLVVMVLIGAMVAIATPLLMGQLPKWRANGATRELAAKLMMARLKAIQNNKEYGVRFVLGDTDRFVFQKYSSTTWYDAGGTGETTADVDIIPAANCDDNYGFNIANFHPNGTTGFCNSIEIKTKDGSVRRKVTLSTTTGNIKVLFCEKEPCT